MSATGSGINTFMFYDELHNGHIDLMSTPGSMSSNIVPTTDNRPTFTNGNILCLSDTNGEVRHRFCCMIYSRRERIRAS